MEKCLFIYNPKATKVNKNNLSKIILKLMTKYEIQIYRSEKEKDITSKVIEYNNKVSIIITMGGDGTLSEAIFGFLEIEQKAIYAHIPAGTTNDFAINMNMPRNNPVKSVDKIINGVINDIDAISVNGKPIAYVSAIGYLTNIPYETPYSLKQNFGYLGYIIKATEMMKKDKVKYHITYTSNNETKDIDCYMIFISNSIGFGGVKIFNDADIKDNLFEVSFVKDINQELIYQVLGDFVKNKINLDKYEKYIEYFKTDKIDIEFSEPYPFMSVDNDGDNADIYVNEKRKKLEYKISGKIKMIF